MPLLVKVSSGLPRGDVDTVTFLVDLVATLAQAPLSDCEIHIKYSERPYHRTTGYAYYNYNGLPFSQQADARVNTHPDARYLVTIKLYAGYAARYTPGLGYKYAGPQVMHYARYKTFPHTWIYTWQEEFVYLLAHEMQHIVQYERPRLASGRASASELECEQAAIRGVDLYRQVLAMTAVASGVGTGHAASR